MAIWLMRAGQHGEHENRFLDEGRAYLTWEGSNRDLSKVATLDDMYLVVAELYPGSSAGKIGNHGRQIYAFTHRIQKDDWVVMPSKTKPVINIGKVTSDYHFDPKATDPYFHWRSIDWFARDIPRSTFDKDLLYSLGAFMTVCRIQRNDAEARIKALAQAKWKKSAVPIPQSVAEGDTEIEAPLDLAEIARDQIANLIRSKFKGHGLERLVEAVLKAQGYTTYHSPEGADRGVDLLAAPGPLGFGHPRICVQVKSQDSPIDTETLDRLIGTMQNVHAEQGLLVSWGGFKSSVDKQVPAQFFRVRFWDQNTLIEQLLEHYDKLDDEIRAELPLRRIWTVAYAEGEE